MNANRLASMGTLASALLLGALTGCAAEPGAGEGSAADEVRGRACASSADCSPQHHCSTEDGVCNPPPGCNPGDICPAVCHGTCVRNAPATGVSCGSAMCAVGEVCCNPSCGICTPPDGVCTQQICDSTTAL